MRRADDATYLIFRASGGSPGIDDLRSQVGRLDFGVWRPDLLHLKVPSLPVWNSLAWWGLHQARLFHSRQYSVLLVRDGQRIVHRSCIMPAWFRWPFMDTDDIQITATWTEPDQRGRGIATLAAQIIVATARPDQTVWYATRELNRSSVAVSRSAGMELAGTAFRTKRFGLRPLGSLVVQLKEPPPDA